MSTTILDQTEIAAKVARARQEVVNVKLLYRKNLATYDDMADAAKALSNLMYDYQKLKFPARRPIRIPYQAILR